MANDKLPPADPVDGYQPQPMGSTAPQHDPHVKQAAMDAAETAQRRSGSRWDDARIDMFVNALTGLGDPNQDKLLGGMSGPLKFVVSYLAGVEVEDRWRGSDLGGRVVEQIPSEMTRMGFELAVQPDDDEALDDLLQQAERRLDSMRDREQLSPAVYAEALRQIRATRARARADLFPNQQGPAGKSSPDPGPAAAGGGAEPAPKEPPKVLPVPKVDEEGQRIVEELEHQLRDLSAIDKFREALEWERAYGGAAILLGVNDGVKEDLTIPLQVDQLRRVKHLTVFRGGWDGELIAWRYYNDPRKANYGMPEIYMLRNIGVPISAPAAPGESNFQQPQVVPSGPAGSLIFYVHESRLLIFPGKAVSRRARVQMRGWGDTIFMRVDEVLSQYSQAWQAIATIMVEWAMGVLKIEGLAEMFSTQGDPQPGGTGPAPQTGLTLVAQRIRAINMAKSNAHTLLLDATEEFKREVAPLTGLAEVLEAFMLRLAAAVDMPVSLLMGQSPGGLRAGDDDVRFFYDRVMSKIISALMPNWRRLIQLLFLAKETSPTSGKEPRKWSVTPRPLRQLNEKEQAEVRKIVAETDAIYYDRGIASAAEIAASRFGGSKWTMETTIDFEAREQASQMAAKAAASAPRPSPAMQQGDEPARPAAPGKTAEPNEEQNEGAPTAASAQRPGVQGEEPDAGGSEPAAAQPATPPTPAKPNQGQAPVTPAPIQEGDKKKPE